MHRRSLFGDDPTGIGESNRDFDESRGSVNGWRWPTRASSPERAVLEALNELRAQSGVDKLDKIFESLTTLRPEQLISGPTRTPYTIVTRSNKPFVLS